MCLVRRFNVLYHRVAFFCLFWNGKCRFIYGGLAHENIFSTNRFVHAIKVITFTHYIRKKAIVRRIFLIYFLFYLFFHVLILIAHYASACIFIFYRRNMKILLDNAFVKLQIRFTDGMIRIPFLTVAEGLRYKDSWFRNNNCRFDFVHHLVFEL